MKEYVVFEIKCQKGIKFSDVYSLVSSTVSFDKNLFALQYLKAENLSRKAHDIYNRLNLSKFEYKVVLEHLLNSPNYDPKRDDRLMISNLDNCWEWPNKTVNESLSDNDFKDLVMFCDSLKASDVSTLILGFDQICWDGKKVDPGTYGFEKADCTYGLGENYLSNSIVIGRTYENKPYTAFISCEKRFRELGVINKIADSLGKVISEEIYYAPENEDERKEWVKKLEEAKLKFENAIAGLQNLSLANYAKMSAIYNPQIKFNIKNYIKGYLCTDGWSTRPARKNERPTVICKTKGDNEIVFEIISGHNGQHLQVLISYSSKEFLLCENLHDLYIWTTSEQDMKSFFDNVVIVRDYFYDLL